MGVMPAMGSFENGKAEGDGADQLAVNVDGRAGHAGEDARALGIRARQARDDARLARRGKARQHA